MSHRLRSLGVAAVTCALAAPGAASAALQISGVAGGAFPAKTYLITLPSRQPLSSSQVTVTENGRPVQDLTVSANAGGKGTRFGTVLAIDASKSMHGGAIADAMRAARAFVAQHDARQPVGLVLFSSTARVALPLTTDGAKITAALATTPPVTPGTHVFDAVQQATKVLTDGKVAAGAIILLSDGTDTGSTVTQPAAVAAAKAAHLRIYSVGLRTRAYDPSTLQSVAQSAGGTFVTAASGKSLSALYGRLGTELSNQYLVRYRSSEALGSAVRVVARVRGFGVATDAYYAPVLKPSVTDGPVRKTFWSSSLAVAIVVGAGALLAALAVLALIAPRESVRSRVGQFVSLPAPSDEKAWTSQLLQRAFGDSGAGRRRRRPSWLTPSAEDLELARITMTPGQILAWTLAVTVLVGWVFVAATSSVAAAPLALVVPFGLRVAIRVQVDRQRRIFNEQLPDNLQVVASAMRAGHTFLGALGVVVVDAPEPSRREFRRVLADEQIGVPLSEALTAVAKRMASKDFEHVALVAALQSETGGNTAQVIDQVTETIRERLDLRRIVRTLTAQGRLAGFVISGLPIVILLIISVLNPGYIYPLFHRGAGIAMLVVAGIMLAAGAVTIRRIVDIDV